MPNSAMWSLSAAVIGGATSSSRSAIRFAGCRIPDDEDDPEARRAPVKGGNNRRPGSWIVDGRGDINHTLSNTRDLRIRSMLSEFLSRTPDIHIWLLVVSP